MIKCGHPDVHAQVARTWNIELCKVSQEEYLLKFCTLHRDKDGISFFIEDNVIHIELTICHLAQHEANARDIINGDALWEVVQEKIQRLTLRTLVSSPALVSC